MADIIRILRVIEYRGPRKAVESQVERSLHGTRRLPNGVVISAATINSYPEILEQTDGVDGFDPANTGNSFDTRNTTLGKPTKEVVLAMRAVDLNISVRAFNCFESAGIETVADLVKYTPEKLKLIKRLGKVTCRQIQTELAHYDLKLAES